MAPRSWDKRGSGATGSGILLLAVSLVAAWGWIVLAQILVGFLPVAQSPLGMASIEVLIDVLFYAPLGVIGLVAAWLDGVRALRGGRDGARWLGGGLALGLAGLLTSAGLSALHGGLVPAATPQAEPGLVVFALALGAVALQVGAEEVLFRGWVQAGLARLTGGAGIGTGAVTLGAVIFALFHLAAGARGVVSLANIALAGGLFGLLALRSGGLWAPFAAHLAWNFTETTVLGLVPNPGVGGFGALVDRDLVGGALMGGGPEGLNASLGTSAALLALILPLAFAWPDKAEEGKALQPAQPLPC